MRNKFFKTELIKFSDYNILVSSEKEKVRECILYYENNEYSKVVSFGKEYLQKKELYLQRVIASDCILHGLPNIPHFK